MDDLDASRAFFDFTVFVQWLPFALITCFSLFAVFFDMLLVTLPFFRWFFSFTCFARWPLHALTLLLLSRGRLLKQIMVCSLCCFTASCSSASCMHGSLLAYLLACLYIFTF